MADTLTLEEFERGLSSERSGFSPVPRRKPDRLSFDEFERGLLKADGPEVLSFEEFEAAATAPLGRASALPQEPSARRPRVPRPTMRHPGVSAPGEADESQSLARSALHSIVQGAVGGAAGFPEQIGIATQRRPRWLLEQYSRIDRGEPPQSRQEAHDWATTPEVVFYSNAPPEARQRLRDEAGASIRPIAEEPAYQVGQRIRESTAEAFPVAPEHEGRFPVQLGRGIGSTATFLATGLVGRLFRLPALPVVAGTGAIANSSEVFRDAIDRGAGFEDAYRASRMAGVVGTSEALPIVKLLGRLDDASGGQIRRLIVRAAQGGIEEGAQELFQSVAENLIASDLVAYDPERGTFQGSGDAAGVGFTVGALMNFLASMLGVKMRHTPRQATEQTVREFRENVVREGEGVPTPPGRSAERGDPFTAGAARPEAVSPAAIPPLEVRAPSPVGTQKVITTRGNEIDVRYELVEADNLVTSHTDDLTKNPAYPQEIQPRQRERAASAQQIAKMAGQLRPELLGVSPKAGGGAPIVGSDGVVESGNGRVLAVRRAYRQGLPGGQKYREWLVDQGYEQAANMREPVLIRRRLTEMTMEQRARFAREANTGTTLGMSTAEQAAADAADMPVGLLDQYQGGNIGAAGNRRFVTSFAKEIVPEGEQARFFTGEGQLSQDGRSRIENAVFAKAYGRPELLSTLREDLDNNIRGLGNALIQAAPTWAQMRAAASRGQIPARLDITEDVLQVIDRIGRARTEGISPQDAMAQIDAFAGEVTPTQQAIFGWFYAGRRPRAWAKVATDLEKYATEASKASTGPNLLGMPDVTPEQLIATVGTQRAVGTPSLARVSGEAGGALPTSAKLIVVGPQAEPFQASVRPEPSGISTARASTPPTIEGTTSTFGEGLSLGAIDRSGRTVIQSFFDPKEGLKQASRLRGGYVKDLRQVTKGIPGASFVKVRVKESGMVRAKATPSRPANTISDYLGGRLLVRDPAALGQVLENVRARWSIVEAENFLETPKAGYRAVHVQVEIAPGFTAELQLVPETIGRVQEKAHVLYNKWKRTTISPAQVKAFKRDVAKMEESFAEAWVKSPFNLLQSALDPTPQGLQTVIPGAERISDRVLAERRMEQSLQPGAAQKPADEGLFDVAGRGQMELPEGPYSGLTPTLPRFAQATGIERPKGRYAGSINLDRLNTPEEIKRAIGFVSKQEAGFKEARRGKISWQETEALAADLGLTVQKLRARRRGEAFNAEQIEAARTLHLASAENLHLLAKKATESGAYQDVLAFDRAYHQHVAIQAEIEGSATEAGRALSIHRKLAEAARGQKAEYIKEIIQSTGGRTSMEELMAHIASLDAEGVGRYVQKAKRATKMEMLREVWYQALLSDVTTQGVNIGSNAVVSLWTVPEHAVSGVIGKMHGGEKVYLREVFGRVYGVIAGAKTGLNMAYTAFETEVPSDLLSKVETQRMKAIPSVRFRKGKEKRRIGGVRIPLTGEIEVGGKQLRIPGRALLAGDEFFKAIGYSQKIHELAIRDGIQKGKRGLELLKHVRKIKRDVPEEMHNQARRSARVQTFTEPLGRAGQAAMNLRERVGMPGWIVAPFMRTPVNIFKFSMKRTPLPLLFPKGEVWEQIRAGGAERDIALGRIAFGSGLMTLVVSYATAGLITGAGPDDPGEKAILRSKGWQPYSFKVGDEYYSYFYYEPLGSLIGIAADFAEIRAKYPEIAREQEWDRLAAMIVGSMTNNLTNKTYMRGLSSAIRAVDDPGRSGERWIRGLSGTLIPTGIAGTARRGDPLLRDARSILDNFKSRIPGLRETLPPRLDPFGREIRNQGALGPDIASRIYRSTERSDKVVDEMLRLKVTPGRPRRVMGGVKLGPEQYVEFVQLWRQSAKKELDILVNAPGWDQLPDHEKRRMIRDAFSAWRDMAEDTMFERYPELLRTQTRQRLEAVTQ